MLFDLPHTLYMVISAIISVVVLVMATLMIKKQKHKDLFLRFFAVVTVLLHYSSLWVDYFTTGEASVGSAQLLIIYPCHMCMWLLLICAFVNNKKSLFFKFVAEFTFYLGIVGGVLGIVFNFAYMDTPSLANWNVLKGLLGHSTMLVGCVYLLCGQYIKIRVFNTISVLIGMCTLLIDGVIVNALFDYFKLSPVNSMYLLEAPFANMPWFNTAFMGVLAVLICFAITATYEWFALKPEDRWYYKLKLIYESKTKKKKEQ